MDYAVFTPEEEIVDPKVVFFSPKEGDPDDYVAIELKSGKRITITNTCAANVLGPVSYTHLDVYKRQGRLDRQLVFRLFPAPVSNLSPRRSDRDQDLRK